MSPKTSRTDSAPAFCHQLEPRVLLSHAPTPSPTFVGPIAPTADVEQMLSLPITRGTTPASVLTKPIRQSLLDGLTLSSTLKNSLQSKLNSNDLAGFDTSLLSYMTTRTNAHYFFDITDASGIGTWITGNIGDGGTTARADKLVSHLFPSSDDTTTYSVNVGTNIDWVGGSASSSSEFLHTLNRQAYWIDLSQAYRFTGNATYANELISELSSWSTAFPTMGIPASWSTADQKSWLLDMGIRTEQWVWSYFQLLGSAAWTKEANTLLLYKMQQQLAFMSTSTSYGAADNRQLFHATGWLYSADTFPEITTANATAARRLAWDCLDGQYYNDGSHHEQSPGYANNGIMNLLELKYLDSMNAVTWPSDRNTKLTNAINAYYQFLTPDGNRPALGDTYRSTSAQTWLTADQVLGVSTWPAAKPRARDAWLFGTTVAGANNANPNFPTPGDRGSSYALPDSGNYLMRSGFDSDARQILFHAGPKGGNHGHFDPMTFELFGYGRPLISDPGLVRYDSSADRLWAISTPAHNTISIDNANVGAMDDIGTGQPRVVVDNFDVQADHIQVTAHHFGYDGLSGKPVLSRSIWYDKDGTMLVVDWGESLQSHTFATSFLLPGSSYSSNLPAGRIQTTNGTGGNVKVQSILRAGQSAFRQTKFVSNNPPPNEEDPAQKFYVTQTGTFVVFATLITAYNGTSAPNYSASFVTTNPTPGGTVQILLDKNGIQQTIDFTPPALTRLPASGANNGSYCDIAYDKSGNLHMAYYDRVERDLKYSMRDTAGHWSIVETIDNGYLTGSNPSIATDSKGHVGIAYTNGNAGDLKYAFFDGTQWKIEVVDSRGSTGHYPSLAFSRGDGPVITYYDKTHGDLRMATSGGSTGWTIQTIDGGSVGAKDVGRFSHLVLDPDRTTATKWGIAYEDSSAGYTMYAIQGNLNGGTYNASTGYTLFKADHSIGGYISLAFDGSNRPSISHYDYLNGDLRWTKSSGSTLTGGISFTAQTVASHGTVGSYTAHYYDSAGKAVILYLDKSHNQLAKARLTTAWSITNLATGGREAHVTKFGTNLAYTNVDDVGVTVYFA